MPPYTKHLIIPHKYNNFSIEFASLSYRNPNSPDMPTNSTDSIKNGNIPIRKGISPTTTTYHPQLYFPAESNLTKRHLEQRNPTNFR